jgi:hypothetical protein
MTATCSLLTAFSLSKRWNVARLTSAISSSPRVTVAFGAECIVSGTSAVGMADADAPPISEKVNPAAPNTGTAALGMCFCFTFGMNASSATFVQLKRQACAWRSVAVACDKMRSSAAQFLFIFMKFVDMRLGAARHGVVRVGSSRVSAKVILTGRMGPS